jgi:hypothetical protein
MNGMQQSGSEIVWFQIVDDLKSPTFQNHSIYSVFERLVHLVAAILF